jgi:hypothetical protein
LVIFYGFGITYQQKSGNLDRHHLEFSSDFFSGQKEAAELAEKRALERELAKVSIKKEDVDLVTILAEKFP